MQFAIIIQARLKSKRLPGKVLKNFKGYSLLSVLISRLQKSKIIKNIIIATTRNTKDIKIVPMGTEFIRIEEYSGGIRFESKLPICRPLIFKNPPPNDEGFDVLHG